MRRRGFTLVELLVVIGIIAVLVGILLPTLNRAREAANRVACASNLRQLGMMMQLYANRYKDFVPLGAISNGAGLQKQWNYIAYYNHAPYKRTILLGWLVDAGLITDGKTFYCPSERYEQFVYKGVEMDPNPWPFAPATTYDTKFGYGTRPSIGWVVTTLPAPPGFVDSNGNKAAMPKWSKQKNLAVITEILINKYTMRTRHKNGVNVLYGNCSVKWVPKDHFLYTGSDFDQVTVANPPDPTDVDSFANPVNRPLILRDFLPSGKPYFPVGGLWGKLDTY